MTPQAESSGYFSLGALGFARVGPTKLVEWLLTSTSYGPNARPNRRASKAGEKGSNLRNGVHWRGKKEKRGTRNRELNLSTHLP